MCELWFITVWLCGRHVKIFGCDMTFICGISVSVSPSIPEGLTGLSGDLEKKGIQWATPRSRHTTQTALYLVRNTCGKPISDYRLIRNDRLIRPRGRRCRARSLGRSYVVSLLFTWWYIRSFPEFMPIGHAQRSAVKMQLICKSYELKLHLRCSPA